MNTEALATIPSAISDGSLPLPMKKPKPPKLDVWNTLSRNVYVNRSPILAGTPRVEGMMRLTMNMALDPELPEAPPQLPALQPDDPKVIEALGEVQQKYRGTELLFISATMYGRSKTLLTVYPNGQREGAVTAVSNLNFSHFSGVPSFRITERDGTYKDYGLLMGLGGDSKRSISEGLKLSGHENVNPAVFEMSNSERRRPEFVVIEGEEGEAMKTIRHLHELYRTEGRRMKSAHSARQRAMAKRKAELNANPPKPEDVTITFWKRTSKPSKLQSQEEGR